MSFGILTLATQNDYLKAIGLALSLKVSNPGVALAVACTPGVKQELAPYYDFVIDQRPDVKGFAQKVYLDHYSPFDNTLFLDSDILVFKPVASYIQSWGQDISYIATGKYVTGGFSSFGFDRNELIKQRGWEKLVCIDGAGHAYFCKPACEPFFARAREITDKFDDVAGSARYADEDVINIVMTEFGIVPPSRYPFFSRHLSAKRGTLDMNASIGKCRGKLAENGMPFEPCMMHFANNEAPIAYTFQLLNLFSKFELPNKELYKFGVKLFWKRYIKLKLYLNMKKLGLK